MPRILLIDDTPEVAELLTFALRDLGHEVFAAGYTAGINEMVLEQRADAVVLHCSAYEMSEALFDILRSHPDHAELPVVIITDTEREADARLPRSKCAKSLVGPKTIYRVAGGKSHRSVACITMPLWSMDDWQYLQWEVITDPKGRQWTVALMDVLGQAGDADMPDKLLELQYSSGRYFTLIYSASGALQRERGYALLPEAESAYEEMLMAVISGGLDPSQPVFRQDLEG